MPSGSPRPVAHGNDTPSQVCLYGNPHFHFTSEPPSCSYVGQMHFLFSLQRVLRGRVVYLVGTGCSQHFNMMTSQRCDVTLRAKGPGFYVTLHHVDTENLMYKNETVRLRLIPKNILNEMWLIAKWLSDCAARCWLIASACSHGRRHILIMVVYPEEYFVCFITSTSDV